VDEDGNEKEGATRQPWREMFVEKVLKDRYLWVLAISYLFVYFIRSGMRSWLHFYLADVCYISAAQAAYRVSSMELGGIAGTLLSGWASDKSGGRRSAVVLAFLVGLTLTLGAMPFIPIAWTVGPLVDIIMVALMGFFINGPQCLLGIIGCDVTDIRAVATATGLLGWISYFGAALSGLPLTIQ